jgi:hypothetical protein
MTARTSRLCRAACLAAILTICLPFPALAVGRILWDTHHGVLNDYTPSGQYAGLAANLRAIGYTVNTNDAGVADIDLSAYDVVVACLTSAWDSAYTADEVDDLEAFVTAGGGLLILSEQPGTPGAATPGPPTANLALLAAAFGVSTGISSLGSNDVTAFARHTVTQGLDSLKLSGGGALNVDSPASAIAWSDAAKTKIVAAAARIGPGRVAVIGDVNLFDSARLPLAGNVKCAMNLFVWLADGNLPMPHLTGGDTVWRDLIEVQNAGSEAAEWSLTLVDKDGQTLAEKSYSLPALGYASVDLKAAIHEAGEAAAGYVLSDNPDVSCRLSYQATAGGGVAQFRLARQTASKLLFEFANFDASVSWKGLAIMNAGRKTANLTLEALGGASGGDGEVLAAASVSLAPGVRRVGVVGDFFTGLADPDAVTAVRATSASSRLAGIAISGTADASKLLFTPAAVLP